MLIKKTIVLSDGINAVGHLSLIRVGRETGAKLTLSRNYEGAYLMIKVGANQQENFKVTGLKSEYNLKGMLEPNDQIGALIVGENGVLASGGIKGMVSEKLPGNTPQLQEKVEGDKVTETVGNEEPKEGVGEPKEIEIAKDTVEESVLGNKSKEAVLVAEEDKENEEEGEANADKEEEAPVEENLKDESPIMESIITPFKSIKGENFYRSIRGKLNEIMTANPREKKLEALIPDSKWVRVYYEKGEYYVVGILTEDGEVTFLSYGVPGVKRVKPPKDAEELCDFVEVEGSLGEGYWVMFQNAKNGEIVKSI